VTRRFGNRRTYRGVSWADHALTWARTAHLPAFNAVVGLASRGGALCQGHVAGTALESPPWWHVAAPDPFPEEIGGVRTPEASWRDGPIGVWLSHVAAPDPLGAWGAPNLYELRREVRRPRSQLSGPDRTSCLPEDKGEGLENPMSTRVDSLSDDFLAG
jgi:hypothetical protein